jgi:hypothetical protein
MTQVSAINGPFDWNPTPPNPPASITVPVYDADGDYTVSWDSSDGASSYTLQEAQQADFSDAATIYSGGDTSKAITGKEDGTYYYRVLASNGAGDSGWRAGANGCLVERPSIKISPDIGWPNREDMLNSARNGLVASWLLAQLVTTATEPEYTKSRYTLIFEHSGVRYKLPESAVGQLGSGKHFWRAENGPIQDFMFVRNAAPPLELPEEIPESPRILS